VDNPGTQPHNDVVTYTDANRIVKEHLAAAKQLRQQLKDPAKARQFLFRAGIAKPSKTNPNDVKIVKRFR